MKTLLDVIACVIVGTALLALLGVLGLFLWKCPLIAVGIAGFLAFVWAMARLETM